MQKVKKAVILAAGYGSRFMPYTKAVSKAMLPIIDTPTIQLIVQEAVDSGIEEILMVVGVNKDNIINHFAQNDRLEAKMANNAEVLTAIKRATNTGIKFVEQIEQNGTGGAIMLARDFTADEPFLLMFADDLMVNDEYPISRQIIDCYYGTHKNVLAVQQVRREDIVRYSSIEYSSKNDRCMNVTKIIEKPHYDEVKSLYSALGRYVLTPEIYDVCSNLTAGHNGELVITDGFGIMAEQGKVVSYDFDGVRYDIGNKYGYLTAVIDAAMADSEYRDKLKAHIESKR